VERETDKEPVWNNGSEKHEQDGAQNEAGGDFAKDSAR